MTPPLANRVAVVTGGTGALGQAVTLRLLADGAAVEIPYAVEQERAVLADRVPKGESVRLTMTHVDVTDDAAMTAFADAVRRRHGRIDILVALVGGFAGGGLVDTDRATWDRMLALNLTSVYTSARAIVPHMAARRHGRVIVTGSRSVVPPTGGFIAYTVAKSGVIAFAQALAAEFRPHGVTVNAVLPSTMDTPANRAAMPNADPKTWVPVESVAAAIALLCRDDAAHVTGSLVRV
ncbi:MAG: SDR family oxidoreductase [Candidatus Rokubacteria bacterium]|nr:SDR family oxidoreductase [Candidatus Rokubacteria bacterium]